MHSTDSTTEMSTKRGCHFRRLYGIFLLSFVFVKVKCSLDKHFAVVVDVDAW